MNIYIVWYVQDLVHLLDFSEEISQHRVEIVSLLFHLVSNLLKHIFNMINILFHLRSLPFDCLPNTCNLTSHPSHVVVRVVTVT